MQVKFSKTSFIMLSIIFFCDTKNIDAKVIFMNSVPKSGTHLLSKCIELLTKRTKIEKVPGYTVIDKNFVASLRPNDIVYGHVIYIPENINHVEKNKFRNFFIYRDPRDQIVSMAYWVRRNIINRPQCKDLTIDDLIMELICKGDLVYCWEHFAGKKVTYMPNGIKEYYELYMPWRSKEYVYTTTFEKLIGPMGGGTQKEQNTEIRNIALYLGIELTDVQIDQIKQKLFGGTMTFRSGQIGAWKTHFKQEHKDAFKAIAGQLLIDLGYENDFSW